jgi:hypothetical protein
MDFVRQGLKVSRPAKIVLLELLMSLNPDYFLVLVRPIQGSR